MINETLVNTMIQEGSPLVSCLLALIKRGMKFEDIVNLKVSDIDFATGKVKDIEGDEEFRKVIGAYIYHNRNKLTNDLLFIDHSNNPMKIANVVLTIKRAAKKLNIAYADLGIAELSAGAKTAILLKNPSWNDIKEFIEKQRELLKPKVETKVTTQQPQQHNNNKHK